MNGIFLSFEEQSVSNKVMKKIYWNSKKNTLGKLRKYTFIYKKNTTHGHIRVLVYISLKFIVIVWRFKI